MVDHQFKLECVRKIQELIITLSINARPIQYIEGSSFVTIKLENYGRPSDIRKYEEDFKVVYGQKTSLSFDGCFALITFPKPNPEPLPLSYIIDSTFFRECPGTLKIAIGEDMEGRRVVGDLEKWVHLLVAGETGSGKTVFLHNAIISLMSVCDTSMLKFIFIDTKRTEFVKYEGLSYLAKQIAYDTDESEVVLKWLTNEMNRRFKLFQTHRCTDIKEYNQSHEREPYIVVIIDEFANLTQDSKTAEKYITKLAQLSRAAGIHLILSTQRPDANVVIPLISANVPTRIAFNVANGTNSRIILDTSGAEDLNKNGDMILKDVDGSKRIQGAYLSANEIKSLIEPYIVVNAFTENEQDQWFQDYREEYADESVEEEGDDIFMDLYDKAIDLVHEHKRCSQWFIKKRLKIGDTLADKVINRLQEEGVISTEWDSGKKSFKIIEED